jgi:hypothetical protein
LDVDQLDDIRFYALREGPQRIDTARPITLCRRTGLMPHDLCNRNCHDNAVAESFFQLLKRERIRKHIYATRQEARSDVFSYIEMFYNPIRRHSSADGLSPVEHERRNSVRLATL